MFEKYKKYQLIQHSWTHINCLTIIEEIYKEHLNINFQDMWNRLNRIDGKTGINAKWPIQYGAEVFSKEIQNWSKIPLTKLREYDILVFVNKRNIPIHFGMYLEQNYFIHIEENKKGEIKFLDDNWRNKLIEPREAFRHSSLV